MAKKVNSKNPFRYMTKERVESFGKDLVNLLDVPQKAMMYGATTLSRGLGNGVYDTPSNIIKKDWGVNNKGLDIAADLTLDPLNLLGALAIKKAKQIEGLQILNPMAAKINKGVRTLKETDNIQDIDSHLAKNSQQFQNGGWLDKYKDGGDLQEYNPNNESVSFPPNFVGQGTLDKGFDYNSAWGGAWKNGGKFLQPNDPKLPRGYKIPNRDQSTELATSIGGENGEPAYLIPSFKYGHPLDNPLQEYKQTNEHLGGPFKTWQEADQWEQEIRHPYVEKGQAIPTPLKRWGELQNGGKMKYYQEGLDFKPKNISKNGSQLIKLDQLSNFTNYNKPQPGGWLEKYSS